MSQITLRNLPPDVESEIRSRSQHRGVSLNRTIIDLLRSATGISVDRSKKRDLSAIAGTWTDKEAGEFDESVQIFERIDEDVWQ